MGLETMELQKAVGATIRSIRHSKGATLRELCGTSYLALGYLSQIENGEKNASFSALESIAKGLDVTTAQLVLEIYNYLEENNND